MPLLYMHVAYVNVEFEKMRVIENVEVIIFFNNHTNNAGVSNMSDTTNF